MERVTPVDCTICAKWDFEKEEPWLAFTAKNQYYFTVFLIARAFGHLPRAGGINDQDGDTMRNLLLLHNIFALHENVKEEEFEIKLAKLTRGLL